MKPSELNVADTTPQRALLTSRSEIREGVVVTIRSAQRVLRCLHADLAPFELSTAEATDCLAQLLLGHRLAVVKLLVDDHHWLAQRAARLRTLQQRFPHALQMRVASADDPVGEDAAILADTAHVLELRPTTQAQGDLWLNNAPHAQPMIAAFDRRWDAAAHNMPVVPLGLG